MREFLNTTNDPAEFFCCWNALHCAKRGFEYQHELADHLDIAIQSIYDYESGRAMPSGGNLHRIEHRMEPDIYALYMALIIRTRSKIIDIHHTAKDTAAAASERQHMPREFYRESIRRLLGGRADDTKAPDWASAVHPIETQGEYLRNIRQAFGKPLDGELTLQKCKELGLPTPEQISAAEGAALGPSANLYRQQLAQFYGRLQQERLEGIDRFSQYNNKPSLDWQFFDGQFLDLESERCLPVKRGNKETKVAAIIAHKETGGQQTAAMPFTGRE